MFQNAQRFIPQPLYAMLKKPTAQIAHLVFADTQANAEKPKELFFCQRQLTILYLMRIQ
jgi:hypothetical protein